MFQSLYFYSLDRFEEILNWVIKVSPFESFYASSSPGISHNNH